MRHLLLASAVAIALPAAANATLLTAFSQESSTNTVTATDNGSVTNISFTDALVTLGGGILGVIPGAVMTLTATSIDAVVVAGADLIQHYSGSFCISSVVGCGGNFLKGQFVDAAFGANGGPGLTVNVNNPPESLALQSNVIPANELQAPSSFNLAFTDLIPSLHVSGTTIGGFAASFAGDISATTIGVPEPASLGILGLGLIGLAAITQRRRHS